MTQQTLRREHTCQIRTTTALDSPLCGQPAEDLRGDVHLWVCPEHQYFGGSAPSLDQGVWPADRRRARIGHWRNAR